MYNIRNRVNGHLKKFKTLCSGSLNEAFAKRNQKNTVSNIIEKYRV